MAKKGLVEGTRLSKLSFFAGTAVSRIRIAVVHPGILDFRIASARVLPAFDEFARSLVERPELLDIFYENPVPFAATSALKREPSMLLVEPHGCDNCADTTLTYFLLGPHPL